MAGRMTLKAHTGKKPKRKCPACRRAVFNPNRRHRTRVRGQGPWCNGKVNELKVRAGALMQRADHTIEDMFLSGRDLISLLSPISKNLYPTRRI